MGAAGVDSPGIGIDWLFCEAMASEVRLWDREPIGDGARATMVLDEGAMLEWACADRCNRCIAAADPASELAYSQCRLRFRHLVHGLISSHFTRALAQA